MNEISYPNLPKTLTPKKKTRTISLIIFFIIVFGLGMAAIKGMEYIEVMTDSRLEQIKVDYYIAGAQELQASILEVVLQCEPLPIDYQNETVNLILLECLDLNQQGGK